MNTARGGVLRKVIAGIAIFACVVIVVDIAATLVTGRTLRQEMAATFDMLGVGSYEEWIQVFTERISSTEVPDEQNAVASYLAAAAVLKTAPEAVDQALADISNPNAEATEEQRDLARKYFEEHPEVLRLAADGAGRQAVYFARDWSAAWNMDLSDLADMRNLERAVCAAATLHHEDGKQESAQGLLGIGMRISSSLDSDPILISALVRMATTATCVHALERVISENEVYPAPAHAILAGLDDESLRHGFTKAMVGEMYCGINGFQAIANQTDGFGLPPLYAWSIVAAWRNIDMAAYLRHMRGLVRESEAPRSTMSDAGSLEGVPRLATLTRVTVPCFGKVFLQRDRHIAYMRCATVAVRLKQYRAEHGEYPDELPAEIAEDDPFSGGPLLYKRDGEGFVVYSVGDNGADDGGVWAEGDSTDERFSKDIAFRCRR